TASSARSAARSPSRPAARRPRTRPCRPAGAPPASGRRRDRRGSGGGCRGSWGSGRGGPRGGTRRSGRPSSPTGRPRRGGPGRRRYPWGFAARTGRPMPALTSQLDPRSQDFLDNVAFHRELVAELDRRLARAADGGGEKARTKHTERGKLLPRERIDALLDTGSPFLEIAPLAAEGMYDDAAPAAGMVCGIGRVMGQEVVIVANDATVKGGTYFPMTVKKHLRAQEVARENRLPCVYLVDSGGAFLPLQDEVFPDKEHFGRIFYNQARLSAENIP